MRSLRTTAPRRQRDDSGKVAAMVGSNPHHSWVCFDEANFPVLNAT